MEMPFNYWSESQGHLTPINQHLMNNSILHVFFERPSEIRQQYQKMAGNFVVAKLT